MRISDWSSDVCSSDLVAAILAGTLPAAQAQVSGDVVRIGVLNDQSGLYADFGGRGSVVAAAMAVEDFGGTVLGKPVEIIAADHQNKPDIAAHIARQWFDVDGVDALTALNTSSVRAAERHVGNACVCTCRSRWWRCH